MTEKYNGEERREHRDAGIAKYIAPILQAVGANWRIIASSSV